MNPLGVHLAVVIVGLTAVLVPACGGASTGPDLPREATTSVAGESETSTLEAARDTVLVVVGEVRFEAELAVTAAQRSRGLSGRDSTAAGSGMLLVLGEERASSIWMKGMRFSLDILWISADCRVVELVRNAPAPDPQELGAVASYTSSVPVAYVLEVNAGETLRHGIGEGDPVLILNVPPDEDGEPRFTTSCGP